MNEHAGQVMGSWVVAVKLGVDHVGQPGDRMPAELGGREGPQHPVARQPSLDLCLLDKAAIVVIDEVVVPHRIEEAQRNRNQEQPEDSRIEGSGSREGAFDGRFVVMPNCRNSLDPAKRTRCYWVDEDLSSANRGRKGCCNLDCGIRFHRPYSVPPLLVVYYLLRQSARRAVLLRRLPEHVQ